jgi:hypothetical protein
MDIKIGEAGQSRCPYCHEELYENSITVCCPQCKTVHHKACVMFSNRCAVMGCEATWAHMARTLIESERSGRPAKKIYPCLSCGAHRQTATSECHRCDWKPRALRTAPDRGLGHERPFGHDCPFCGICDYETREVTKDLSHDPVIKLLAEDANVRFFLRVCEGCGHISLFRKRS